MSKDEKNIKTYNHYLWIFILVNLAIYICVVIKPDFSLSIINDTYKNLIVKNGAIAAVSALVTFILNSVLSSDFKATLVFWRIKNIYPGCRIFTELAKKDMRIDKEALIKTYGELPLVPEMQNMLWYRIFKPNQYDPTIFESHKSFLLSRDLTGLSFLFILIYTLAALIYKFVYLSEVPLLYAYFCFLVFQYILLSHVGRRLGNRFACNVLAVISNGRLPI
jgi:hypothetical protein